MELLRKRLVGLGFEVSDDQIEKFRIYMDGVLEYNQHINLTSITDHDEFIDKHFADSILGTDCDEFIKAKNVIDVGTGGGFPGVPMAIMNPDKEFILLDSLKKRLKIIDELCERAGINNVRTLHMRAEDAGKSKEYRQSFDLCVSRAVASMPVLSELCVPLVKEGGYFMAYKGPGYADELDAAKKAISITGGKVIEVREFKSSDLSFDHNVIVVKKVKPTPKAYPRKAGTPNKEPIK